MAEETARINPPLLNIYWQALHSQNFLTTSGKLEYILRFRFLHGYLATWHLKYRYHFLCADPLAQL